MVTFSLVSEGDSEIREVTCQRCGTVNPVRIGMSGTMTIFCKGCGMEIKLTSDLTLVGLELKREEDEELKL
jgi:late competence protein required for DNA uptake (superfamily II DNA/RNA helicase)